MHILHQLLIRLSALYKFPIVEQRGRIQRFNSVLSIYVYNEDNAKHNRPHAHITLNNKKIGEIFIDTWEICDRNNILNHKYKEQINEWLKQNKNKIIDEWNKCNHNFEIEFNSYYF